MAKLKICFVRSTNLEHFHAGNTRQHYEHFIIEALAMDRRSSLRSPEKRHMADKEWSEDPVKLMANMYELTEALCHNYWYVLFGFNLTPSAWKTAPWPHTFPRRPCREKNAKC